MPPPSWDDNDSKVIDALSRAMTAAITSHPQQGVSALHVLASLQFMSSYYQGVARCEGQSPEDILRVMHVYAQSGFQYFTQVHERRTMEETKRMLAALGIRVSE